MKRTLAVLGEMILMLITALVFMFWRPFHVTFILWQNDTGKRTFQADWIIGVLILALVITGIEALLKRIRIGFPQVAIAFVLTLVIGFVAKFGFTLTNFTTPPSF
ncbi:MAG: hypothetical protein JSS87_01235 [Acidobacteria bacterium]|nr:hypothetical protein [Acidobacteriota bacterium]